MHNWEEWEISPLPGPPVRPHGQRGPAAAGGGCWGVWGDWRGSRAPLCLPPPVYCLSATYLAVGKEKCWLCVRCLLLPNLSPSPRQELEEQPLTPNSAVVPQPSFLLYARGCVGTCTRACVGWCHQCVLRVDTSFVGIPAVCMGRWGMPP